MVTTFTNDEKLTSWCHSYIFLKLTCLKNRSRCAHDSRPSLRLSARKSSTGIRSSWAVNGGANFSAATKIPLMPIFDWSFAGGRLFIGAGGRVATLAGAQMLFLPLGAKVVVVDSFEVWNTCSWRDFWPLIGRTTLIWSDCITRLLLLSKSDADVSRRRAGNWSRSSSGWSLAENVNFIIF